MFVHDVGAPVLDDRDVHHLMRVQRLRAGETISVADGSGRWRLCALAITGGDRGGVPSLEPTGDVAYEAVPRPAIVVAFAPTKGERPEWAVAKLTELGVDRIVPLVTARSVVRWEGGRSDRHHQRWTEIGRQSAMQSRQVRLPIIDRPTTVAALVADAGGLAALAVPGGAPPTLEFPTVLIGPEGGWADEEARHVDATVGLGPQVLRAETATVVAAALYISLRAGVVAERSVGIGNHAK